MSKSNAAAAAAITAATGTTDQAAAPAVQPADPFANLPVITLGDTKAVDLSAADVPAGPARKYEKEANSAAELKSPMKIGWKHERAVFLPGTNRKELKASSVHGTVQRLVNAAGRQGLNAIDLVTELRKAQVGNKRSVFCNAGDKGALPAVGWAEGWINSAVTRNIVSISATKQAPLLRAEPKPEAKADGDAGEPTA
jgi:hypothetical protein